MAKERIPLGLRPRKALSPTKEQSKQDSSLTATKKTVSSVKPKKEISKDTKIGRPSTKKGKKLVKYSMDIHPELKRAVVKAAAIYDKDVHLMWNEIIYDWLVKEQKKNPGWFATINVKKSEL